LNAHESTAIVQDEITTAVFSDRREGRCSLPNGRRTNLCFGNCAFLVARQVLHTNRTLVRSVKRNNARLRSIRERLVMTDALLPVAVDLVHPGQVERIQLIAIRECGQALVEYSLILGLISVVAAALLTAIGTDVKAALQSMVDAL
jgi:Flp pilus assembly pilin Flp